MIIMENPLEEEKQEYARNSYIETSDEKKYKTKECLRNFMKQEMWILWANWMTVGMLFWVYCSDTLNCFSFILIVLKL